MTIAAYTYAGSGEGPALPGRRGAQCCVQGCKGVASSKGGAGAAGRQPPAPRRAPRGAPHLRSDQYACGVSGRGLPAPLPASPKRSPGSRPGVRVLGGAAARGAARGAGGGPAARGPLRRRSRPRRCPGRRRPRGHTWVAVCRQISAVARCWGRRWGMKGVPAARILLVRGRARRRRRRPAARFVAARAPAPGARGGRRGARARARGRRRPGAARGRVCFALEPCRMQARARVPPCEGPPASLPAGRPLGEPRGGPRARLVDARQHGCGLASRVLLMKPIACVRGGGGPRGMGCVAAARLRAPRRRGAARGRVGARAWPLASASPLVYTHSLYSLWAGLGRPRLAGSSAAARARARFPRAAQGVEAEAPGVPAAPPGVGGPARRGARARPWIEPAGAGRLLNPLAAARALRARSEGNGGGKLGRRFRLERHRGGAREARGCLVCPTFNSRALRGRERSGKGARARARGRRALGRGVRAYVRRRGAAQPGLDRCRRGGGGGAAARPPVGEGAV